MSPAAVADWGDMRHPSTVSSAAWTALPLALLLFVAGCSSTAPVTGESSPEESASATAVTDSWPGVEFGGTGPSSETIAVPKGAKSISIDFVCTGGMFTIGMGGPHPMETDPWGACGGARSYQLPLTNTRSLVVSISVADDAAFALTSSFSASPVEPDPAVGSVCENLSLISSSLRNATVGFDVGDVTLDEWTASVEQADADVAALSEATRGLIAMPLALLSTALADAEATPETLLASSEYMSGSSLANQVCADNGTALTITDLYGG